MQNQSEISNFKIFFNEVNFEGKHLSPYHILWEHTPDTITDWMHNHSCLEIGRCNQGTGIFNINGKVNKMQSKCAMIVYPFTLHSAKSNKYDLANCNFLYIDLPYYLSYFSEGMIAFLKNINYEDYDYPSILPYNKYPEINNIIDQIFDENKEEKGSDEKLACLIASLLITHFRLMKKKNESTSNASANRIYQAINYINANYEREIMLDDLAKMCNLSSSSLRREFYLFANMSPMNYLSYVRIKNAAILLISTNKTILEISSDVGYNDVSSFNRQFLNYYKISPREYRKNHH